MLPEQLTEREKEVLRLVAQGATNRSISAQLEIAEATVENHLHHIYAKLNITNRAQATAWAFHSGLVTPGGGEK